MKPSNTARAGRVLLVGAGPGDPELMTLKAIRALESADVVLHDALVGHQVLQHARAGARLVDVGKRGGCASTAQEFIEHLMIREARAGNVVVRLKGGDPFIFGRGGEEIDALRSAGIGVEVIPGVTAASAAAAAIACPLTHREHTQGVAFVTGHAARPQDEPDWRALVASGLTLAIYMGVARAAEIVARLREAGLPADMPVAVVAKASRPQQRVLAATLGAIVDAIASAPALTPAIMLVGRTMSVERAACIGLHAVNEERAAAQG